MTEQTSRSSRVLPNLIQVQGLLEKKTAVASAFLESPASRRGTFTTAGLSTGDSDDEHITEEIGLATLLSKVPLMTA